MFLWLALYILITAEIVDIKENRYRKCKIRWLVLQLVTQKNGSYKLLSTKEIHVPLQKGGLFIILQQLRTYRSSLLSYKRLWYCCIPLDQKSKQRVSLPLEGLKIIIGLYGDGTEKNKHCTHILTIPCYTVIV